MYKNRGPSIFTNSTNQPRIAYYNSQTMLHMSKNRHSLKIDFAQKQPAGPLSEGDFISLSSIILLHFQQVSQMPQVLIFVVAASYSGLYRPCKLVQHNWVKQVISAVLYKRVIKACDYIFQGNCVVFFRSLSQP